MHVLQEQFFLSSMHRFRRLKLIFMHCVYKVSHIVLPFNKFSQFL